MSFRFPREARRCLAAYGNLPASTRAHVFLRWLSCPFAAVEEEVPKTGSVLDLGCGHGLLSLYISATGPERRVQGVDVDAAKVREATAAASAFHSVSFVEASDGGWRPQPDESWDAIVIVDMLYLLGSVAAFELLATAAAALCPGGRLVIKEIDFRPRWKYQLAVLQERMATRVARVTQGEMVDFLAPSGVARVLQDAGLTVKQRSIHRGYPHPHVVLTAVR